MSGRNLFFAFCILVGLGSGWWLSAGRPALRWESRPAGSDPTAGITVSSGTSGNLFAGTSAKPSAGQSAQNQAGDPISSTRSLTGPISYYDGIMKVAPSVVSLYTGSTATDPATAPVQTSDRQGSGVIVDADGIILTNLHIVADQDNITVVLSNGATYPGMLIGSDQETDLAVVKIAESNLPFVPLGDAPPLRVGDVVLAIGNPFGVGQTVTQGIVSATHRRIAGGSVWQNFVQIDAAINPGNSGGALINPYGQLVGVNTAVFRGELGAEGIGFSIPAELLVQVVPQIIENGTVARGWLGVGVEDLSNFNQLTGLVPHGAVITAVLPDSPASRGGLRPSDIVTHLNETEIDSATQLLLAVSAQAPDSTTNMRVLRPVAATNSSRTMKLIPQELTVLLGTRPDLSAMNSR